MDSKIKFTSISKKTVIYILIFSSIFSLLLTAFQLFLEYKRNKEIMEEGIEIAQISSGHAISKTLWLMEENIIKAQISGLLQVPNIEKVEIKGINEEDTYYVGEVLSEYNQERVYPLNLEIENDIESKYLGDMVITISYDSLYQNLIYNMGVIFLNQTIKTFFVSLLIIFLLHKLIIRHLIQIANYVKGFSMDTFPYGLIRKLNLERKESNDEISLLENEINNMRSRLYWHLDEILIQKNALRKEVEIRERAEIKLKNQFDLSNSVLDAMRDIIITVSIDGLVKYANKSAKEHFAIKNGGNIKEALNITCLSVDENNNRKSKIKLIQLLNGETEKIFSGYCLLKHKEQMPVTITIRNTILPNGELGKVIVLVDESQSDKLAEISYTANHDLLTGLYNRHRFGELIRHLKYASIQSGQYTLAYIDLDNFKSINDVFGHSTGDEVVKSVANCILTIISSNDMPVRFGGDEFVVIIRGDIQSAHHKMDKLLEALQDIDLNNGADHLYLSASIGLTPIYSSDSERKMLTRADLACYEIKRNGGAGVSINFSNVDLLMKESFNPTQYYHSIKAVKKSIKENRLRLYSQKIVPLSTSHLPVRHEVLVRLFDSSGDILPLAQTLAATDKYNITPKIDLWVMQALTRHISDGGLQNKHLNINLSPQSIHSSAVYSAICELLVEAENTGHKICFELTEGSLVKNIFEAQRFIEAMRDKGCLFALDDFGSGYASFGILKNLTLDMLKLDGSIVKFLEREEKNKKIISSIYQMASAMNLLTVAEHTSSQSALSWLKELGVDYSQSYLHATPSPMETSVKLSSAIAESLNL